LTVSKSFSSLSDPARVDQKGRAHLDERWVIDPRLAAMLCEHRIRLAWRMSLT
jgi:hypothetical protein